MTVTGPSWPRLGAPKIVLEPGYDYPESGTGMVSCGQRIVKGLWQAVWGCEDETHCVTVYHSTHRESVAWGLAQPAARWLVWDPRRYRWNEHYR